MKLLSVAVLLLLVQAAAAEPCDPLPNGIGIYFDREGCASCATPPLYAQVSAYVLATNVDPELGGISGFEFKLLHDSPMPLALTVPDLTMPIVTLPYCTYPLIAPDAPAILLLGIVTLYLGEPIRFGLGPCVPSSGDGTSPMIRAGNDLALWVPLRPSIQSMPWPGEYYGYAVAWVGDCPVAAEETSWGVIKRLYE